MVSYCKFIYILLFSSAMHSLICYSSNPWTPTITAQWSHSADGRRISCWWSASCLSRLHITTNTEQRNFCLSCQSSRSVLHSNLLEFKFCSSLKSNSGNYRQTYYDVFDSDLGFDIIDCKLHQCPCSETFTGYQSRHLRSKFKVIKTYRIT